MIKKLPLATALLLVAGAGGIMAHQLTTSSPASSGCGVERWSVKTGSDVGASSVNVRNPAWASVHSMQELVPPSTLPVTSRITPAETTDDRMTVTLVQIKREADSDYHLVIEGASGRNMIAEIPSPACVSSDSPFRNAIAAARATVDARITVTGSWTVLTVPIALRGVGFFDRNHGQAGVAPNGVELHPVLFIRFLAAVHVQKGHHVPFSGAPDDPGSSG